MEREKARRVTRDSQIRHGSVCINADVYGHALYSAH